MRRDVYWPSEAPPAVQRSSSAPLGNAPPPVSVGDASGTEGEEEGEYGGGEAIGEPGAVVNDEPANAVDGPWSGSDNDAEAEAALAAFATSGEQTDKSAPRRATCRIEKWTPARVGRWLASIGLDEYVARFAEQHVDGASLRMLSRDDLNALGVLSVGHRLQILRGVGGLVGEVQSAPPSAVRELRFGEATSAPTSTATAPGST
jgi:hypothetical protein